jgi:hypothetical protein
MKREEISRDSRDDSAVEAINSHMPDNRATDRDYDGYAESYSYGPPTANNKTRSHYDQDCGRSCEALKIMSAMRCCIAIPHN